MIKTCMASFPILFFLFIVFFILSLFLAWTLYHIKKNIFSIKDEIKKREPNYLEPLVIRCTSIHMQSFVEETNRLFGCLKMTLDHNRQFAADAAHELCTPLAAVKTQSQVVLQSKTEAERNAALKKVIHAVDRSTHVVTQLLTLSRVEQEEGLSDLGPVNLHDVITETVTYLVPQALEKNIEIELLPSPAEAVVAGNETALGILIRNVVDNAIRYTPRKGQIELSVTCDDRQVSFNVIDTGPGIPADLEGRIFQRFFRVLGNQAPGSGLGLAIVKRIADLHHATIYLQKPATHVGLHIRIDFPKIARHGSV